MTFSATDAAFEGFRVVRRKPLVLLWWTLAYLAMMALMLVLAIGPITSLVSAAEALEGVTQPTPEDMAPFMAAFGAMMFLVMPLGLLFGAVLSAAVARSVIEPAKSAFGYLRVGMDELRVLVVTLVLALMAGGGLMVVSLLAGILSGVAVAAFGNAGLLAAVLVGIAVVVLFAWVAARLSLAVPITLAEKRIAIFDSWKLTKGRALPIIGMAILAFIMTIVVSILFSVVLFPAMLGLGMTGGWEQLARMDGAAPAEILTAMWPFLAVTVVVQAVGAALQLAVAYAPFSAAYRDLKGLPAAE